MIRNTCLLFLFLPFSLLASTTEFFELDPEINRAIERRLDQGILVGLVIGVTDTSGMRYASFGRKALNSEEKPNKDTVFDIGSISKTFTATLLADSVAKNKVAYDTPLEDYLPPSVVVPDYNQQAITLRHLATHTSSLPRRPYNISPDDPFDTYGNYTVKKLYLALANETLHHAPGQQVSYSSFGFGTLAHTLSLQAGKDIESLLHETIFQPLSLLSTSSQLSSKVARQLAQGYSYHIPTLSHVNPVWPSLKSSPRDMLQYLGANAGLIDTPLSGVMRATHKVQFQQGVASFKQAIGWWVDQSAGRDIILHNGFTHGYRSFAAVDKNAKRAVIVLSNSSGYIDDIGMRLVYPEFELWQSRQPLSIAFHRLLEQKSVDKVIEIFKAKTEAELANYYVNESGFNDMGLYFVRMGNSHQGVKILQYANWLIPESANLHDSLGWAYEQAGNHAQAIVNYQKALSLDGTKWSAKERLRQLQ